METTTQYLKRVKAEREASAAKLADEASALPAGSPERKAAEEKAEIFASLNRRAAGRMRKGNHA